MSRDFLTVEDCNSVLYANQKFWWQEIDTWEITEDKDFANVKYDSFEVTRTSDSSRYTFFVKPKNSLFANSCYALSKDGENIDAIPMLVNGDTIKIEVSRSYPSLRIFVYMGLMPISTDFELLLWRLKTESLDLNLKQLNSPQPITIIFNINEDEVTFSKTLNQGFNLIEYSDNNYKCGYLLVNLLKTDFVFNCNQSLTVGKINKVYLDTDNDYKLSGALVGSYTPKITVDYNGETLPVQYDETQQDYYFNLDLTEVTEPKTIRFTVKVEGNEVLNSTETLVKLTSNYPTINTFDALQSACSSNGIIRLGANITFTNRISISNSIKIIGNDKVLDLDGYGFNLLEDKQLTIQNAQLNNGDTAIKQTKNTKLELTNVSFTGCQSSNYSNLGACILCDIDYPSLSVTDDFITILNNCIFTNNHSNILHGGELNINNCRFHNTNTDYVDKSNTAFIYQVDGDCTILNSVFDIDYGTDYSLCTGETNIGYAQTIFMIGETATLNNLNYNDLKGNYIGDFFENLQNNRSHIYAKYYYPQIEACVFVSPTPNNEHKSFCYGLSSEDTIYKVNTQITRASSNTENNQRTITW